MPIPTYDNLFNPLLTAMHQLGGSGSIPEIEEKVAQILKLSEKEINESHRGNRTKLSYRLAWARNYLKRFKLLENSSRGVWSLSATGQKTETVSKEEVNKVVKKLDSKKITTEDKVSEENGDGWQDALLNEISIISPQSFERLCQRILRESGFIQVAITGRPSDGGIDGRGVFLIGGLLSFHVIFQCKRYVGSVASKQIRDFRGAMVGRADKGLFITTGTFTREAKLEASRDGAPAIDLVDGQRLALKLKELGLGVRIKTEELIEIDKDWFKGF